MSNDKTESPFAASRHSESNEEHSISRKDFLKIGGVSAAAALGLTQCSDIPNAVEIDKLAPLELGPDPHPNDIRVWIGKGDVGLMNTILIFSRLELAFYTKVLKQSYAGMTQQEKNILSALKEHERAHSDFLSEFLGDSAVNGISYTFDRHNFNSRSDILNAAYSLENIGVSIYNTYPVLLKRDKLYKLLTKLGSVEARHAAAIKYLLDPTHNFDTISSNGLDVYTSVHVSWGAFSKYVVELTDITGLPSNNF